MITDDTLTDAVALGTATLHEAGGRIGSLPATIRATAPGMRLAGPAYPVRCPPGDNLWIHRSIYSAAPGDVLVVATGDVEAVWGYWGEIMTVAAQQAGLAGLVLQGGSRDHDALAEIGFPVFSLGPCITGTIKDKARDHGRLGEPVHVGATEIRPGDLVVGDTDGVVVIPAARVDEVVALGHTRVDKERAAIEALRRGARTIDLYDLG